MRTFPRIVLSVFVVLTAVFIGGEMTREAWVFSQLSFISPLDRDRVTDGISKRDEIESESGETFQIPFGLLLGGVTGAAFDLRLRKKRGAAARTCLIGGAFALLFEILLMVGFGGSSLVEMFQSTLYNIALPIVWTLALFVASFLLNKREKSHLPRGK